MKMLRWVIFSLGCVMLIAAFGIGWANWGKLANQIGVMQFLMGAIGVTFSVLVIIGILSRDSERWTISALAAILLLGFSALVFFSIGWLIAPLALFLLGFSIWKMLHRQTACCLC